MNSISVLQVNTLRLKNAKDVHLLQELTSKIHSMTGITGNSADFLMVWHTQGYRAANLTMLLTVSQKASRAAQGMHVDVFV